MNALYQIHLELAIVHTFAEPPKSYFDYFFMLWRLGGVEIGQYFVRQKVAHSKALKELGTFFCKKLSYKMLSRKK